MNTWINLRSPGYARRWVLLLDDNPPADEPMHRFLAAYCALMSMVQPLSVTFEMACRSEEFPFIESAATLPHRTWHIREAVTPAHVEVNARFRADGHQEFVIEQLTIDALEQCLTKAHQQPAEDGYLPTLYALEMHYTRARVLDDSAESALLVNGAETYVIPIETRADGRWATGPVRDSLTNPPIKVQFDNVDGRLVMAVVPGWSSWYDVGAPGQQALEGALREMIAQGWQPESVTSGFDLG